MEKADFKYKYSIRRELYDLIENSSDAIIREKEHMVEIPFTQLIAVLPYIDDSLQSFDG